jgi:hypothetical protein
LRERIEKLMADNMQNIKNHTYPRSAEKLQTFLIGVIPCIMLSSAVTHG